MTSWMRNQLTKLYNAVSASMTATPVERLQSIRDTASLLDNKMMENMGYGIWTGEIERYRGKRSRKDIDLTPHEYGRALMRVYRSFRASHKLGLVPDHFNTQEACNKIELINPLSLVHVPDCFKTHEMCDKAVEEGLGLLEHVPNQYKAQEMYDKAIEEDTGLLEHVPDQYKTQKMCIK